METRIGDRILTDKFSSAGRVDAAGWGLFCIWIGTALYMHVGTGATLLGIGIIIVATQVVLKCAGHTTDRFRATIGFLFVTAGVWNLFAIKIELFPFLCIAAGAIFLIATMTGKPGLRSYNRQ